MRAAMSSRYALAATLFGRAVVEEALRLHPGENFVCTYLTLQRSDQLFMQSQLEGTTRDERTTAV